MPVNNPFRFFVELMQQPVAIPIWVFYLMGVNMASVEFWREPLAKLIFITSHYTDRDDYGPSRGVDVSHRGGKPGFVG